LVIERISIAVQNPLMATESNKLLPEHYRREMRPDRIGHRLYLLRKAKRLEKAEMADMLGIERTYWSRFENGKRPVSDDVAALLVARFDVTLDFLVLGRWEKLPLALAEEMRTIDSQNN
jgi:transcriptional regulator with XRE-family HTH domain